MTVFEASTLAKRPEFELIAIDTGWALGKHSESTDFGRDGWRIGVRWTDGVGYPASLVVYDPEGRIARAMSFLADQWAVGGELLMQLKSPGPLRVSQLPLRVVLAGYAVVLEETERVQPGYRIPVQAVAERLREFLAEAGGAS